MSMPAKWLAAVAGRTSSSLVPDRMLRLRGKDLDILIYPMDILISGKSEDVTRARAAMASRLTTSAAHLTVTAEAQAIEDRLTALAEGTPDEPDRAPRFDEAAAAEFASIDEALATIRIPYEEWEVLYRQRLQVERDLRAGAMAGEAVLGAETPGIDGPGEAIASVGRMLRAGCLRAHRRGDRRRDGRGAGQAGRSALAARGAGGGCRASWPRGPPSAVRTGTDEDGADAGAMPASRRPPQDADRADGRRADEARLRTSRRRRAVGRPPRRGRRTAMRGPRGRYACARG